MARNTDTARDEHDDTITDDHAVSLLEDGLREWATTRPTAGAALLALGSAVLVWQAGSLLAGVPLADVTPAGFAGVAAPILGVLVALFAVARPGYSTAAGLTGGTAVLYDFVGMLYTPTPIEHPQLVFSALLAAGVGAVLCIGWRSEGPSVRLGRFDSVFGYGRSLIVVGLVVLMLLNGAPAVTAQERVPQQQGELGGLVLDQGTLDAGFYSYQANCPQPEDPLITMPLDFDFTEPCLDVTVDSSERASGSFERTARQQLDSAKGRKVIIGDFLIFKNFYNPDTDKWDHVELSATRAIADTGDGEDPRAVSVFISEYRAENNEARLNLVDVPLIEDPGLKVDNVDYWTCTPHNESGQGTINDIRFKVDSNPTLTDGEDATLLAHQLGSTKTTLTNFKLKVRYGKRERPVADAHPTDPPSNCLNGTLKD